MDWNRYKDLERQEADLKRANPVMVEFSYKEFQDFMFGLMLLGRVAGNTRDIDLDIVDRKVRPAAAKIAGRSERLPGLQSCGTNAAASWKNDFLKKMICRTSRLPAAQPVTSTSRSCRRARRSRPRSTRSEDDAPDRSGDPDRVATHSASTGPKVGGSYPKTAII